MLSPTFEEKSFVTLYAPVYFHRHVSELEISNHLAVRSIGGAVIAERNAPCCSISVGDGLLSHILGGLSIVLEVKQHLTIISFPSNLQFIELHLIYLRRLLMFLASPFPYSAIFHLCKSHQIERRASLLQSSQSSRREPQWPGTRRLSTTVGGVYVTSSGGHNLPS